MEPARVNFKAIANSPSSLSLFHAWLSARLTFRRKSVDISAGFGFAEGWPPAPQHAACRQRPRLGSLSQSTL